MCDQIDVNAATVVKARIARFYLNNLISYDLKFSKFLAIKLNTTDFRAKSISKRRRQTDTRTTQGYVECFDAAKFPCGTLGTQIFNILELFASLRSHNYLRNQTRGKLR